MLHSRPKADLYQRRASDNMKYGPERVHVKRRQIARSVIKVMDELQLLGSEVAIVRCQSFLLLVLFPSFKLLRLAVVVILSLSLSFSFGSFISFVCLKHKN